MYRECYNHLHESVRMTGSLLKHVKDVLKRNESNRKESKRNELQQNEFQQNELRQNELQLNELQQNELQQNELQQNELQLGQSHKCPMCQRKFRQKSSLLTHLGIHI